MRRFKTIIFVAIFLFLFSSAMLGVAYGSGSISGTVSYSGAQTGAVYVAVSESQPSCSPPEPEIWTVIQLSGPGNYTISGLSDGTYYLVSLLASCGTGCAIQPTDPWGIFGGCGSPLPIIISGGDSVGNNVSLVDGTEQTPNPFYDPYDTSASSGHDSNGYFVSLRIEDEGNSFTSVSVTGPGITGSLNLVYDAEDARWVSSLTPKGNPSFGSSPPPTPITYDFTIIDAEGTHYRTEIIEGFVDLATKLSPSGGKAIAGIPVFSWTGPTGNYTYRIKVSGNGIDWRVRDITDTTIDYGGLPLTIGSTYNWDLEVYDRYGNSSRVRESFAYVQGFPLTVNKDGTGSGTVLSSVGGIDCGTDCVKTFPEGTMVTLTAIPNTGFAFTTWSGEGCSGKGYCVVKMDAVKNVTATFATANGSVSGTVSYSGSKTGDIYVAAMTSPFSCSPPNPEPYTYVEIFALGSYTLSGLPDGDYYIVSVIVSCGKNCDLQPTDPWGVYGGCDTPTPVTISNGNAVNGIDITLVDGSGGPSPFGDDPYEVSASSGHRSGLYWVDLRVDDADRNYTSVSVTGPGISGSLALVYDADKGRWASWLTTGYPEWDSDPPVPPLTYNFTITQSTGSVNRQGIVTNFVDLVEDLSPSGKELVSGSAVFSWKGLGGNYTYQINIYDNVAVYWDVRGLTNTSVPYGGTQLTLGNTYYWYVQVRDKDGNKSIVDESFVYFRPVYLISNVVNFTDTEFLARYKTISIDGDYSDWDIADRVYLDTDGPECGDAPGQDIREVYAAQDDEFIYLRFVLNGPLDETSSYEFGENSLFAAVTQQNGSGYIYFAWWGTGSPPDIPDTFVHVDGDQFEFKLFKTDVVSWKGRKLAAWADIGSPTTCRDKISLPEMNLNLPQTTVSLIMSAGATGTVNITGGTGAYSVSSSNNDIATAELSGNTISISGIADGLATITITDGMLIVATVEVKVVTGGKISGIVTANGGQPAADLLVKAIDYVSNDFAALAVTQPDGSYTINDLPQGNYRIAVETAGKEYLGKYYDNVYDFNAALPVKVEPQITTTGINFSLDKPSIISGQVTGSDGQPVQGVNVAAFLRPCWDNCMNRPEINQVGKDTTDENGIYTLLLPPGDIYVYACANCEGLNFINEWWDGTGGSGSCKDAMQISLSAEEEMTNIDFSLTEGSSVSGRVMTSDDQPVGNAGVGAFSGLCHDNFLGQGTTDDNGYYTISGIPLGNVYVFTGQDDYNLINEWWDGAEGTFNCYYAEPLNINNGVDLTGVDFSLNEGNIISGHVESGSGQPLEGIGVGVFRGQCRADNPCRENLLKGIQTNSSGNYIIQGVPEGNVYIGAFPVREEHNYIGEWWNGSEGALSCDAALPATVVTGVYTSGIDFSLNEGGFITGRIISDEDQPVKGVLVSASPGTCRNDFSRGVHTDEKGNYVIKGIPSGDVYIGACANCEGLNYITEWWDGAQGVNECSASAPVQIVPGEFESAINFSLEKGGTISGQVTDSEGQFLEGVRVTAFTGSCSETSAAQTLTDSNGNYVLAGLPSGGFYLSPSSTVEG